MFPHQFSIGVCTALLQIGNFLAVRLIDWVAACLPANNSACNRTNLNITFGLVARKSCRDFRLIARGLGVGFRRLRPLFRIFVGLAGGHNAGNSGKPARRKSKSCSPHITNLPCPNTRKHPWP